jgi:hypothetical protein
MKVLLDTNAYTLFKSKAAQDALNIVNFADEIGVPNVVVSAFDVLSPCLNVRVQAEVLRAA